MAHAFLRLQRLDLAEHVATTASQALAPRIEGPDATPQELSLYGATHLVLAVIAARDNNRPRPDRTSQQPELSLTDFKATEMTSIPSSGRRT